MQSPCPQHIHMVLPHYVGSTQPQYTVAAHSHSPLTAHFAATFGMWRAAVVARPAVELGPHPRTLGHLRGRLACLTAPRPPERLLVDLMGPNLIHIMHKRLKKIGSMPELAAGEM